ncbi:MAG: hypothetical protein NC411_02840 [Bacteroides sp.]|nr:hypothetical protein [Bacteroides sp.]
MIKEATYYEVFCDHCGERLSIDGTTAWESQEDAEEALNYAGWQMMQDEKVYCESCLDSDEVTYGVDSIDTKDLYDE